MTEYIEREAVYDIFTAKQQELLKRYQYYQLNDEEKEEFNRYDGYLNEIEAIPAADVVEVVRCKDCKCFELMTSNNQYFCNRFGGYVTENDYCSRCRRKDGAGE
jgi:hypothetical protein